MHFRIRVNGIGEESLSLLLAPFDIAGVTWSEDDAEIFTESPVQAAQIATLFNAGFEKILNRNWSEEWQRDWQPIEVGRSFFLYPPDYIGANPHGRIGLEMIPGNVFGGGDHPTTQLCLEALEDIVRPGMRVADIGAGTAILKRAAEKLGATAIACDIDPAAMDFVDYLGSADALASNCFDVVVANIHPGVLREIHGELVRLGGTLVLSGFLPDQANDIIALFGKPVALHERHGWALYIGASRANINA